MVETLILISEDAHSTVAIIPEDDGTIHRISYEVLIQNPYKYSESEFHHEVHVVRRNRTDLRIESYNIRRSKLLKRFGWGIHLNSNGKLALVGANSDEYQNLATTIATERAVRISAE
ncbi:hypothetical protein CXF72_11615 [Psychromonas sp. MB-3u-54]|uniref:DUF6157 family protein n=1 Tax=Psychromonas sp. MB-3u-54 TaxID=2058319 RepID=UPI000C348856|nr:DUF6157 family protein [Psychromonas sp. MB-3u-54]PKH02447.1 hypothetical protein CXF72_11615 [Psychromonas sp. MB-3u-54]